MNETDQIEADRIDKLLIKHHDYSRPLPGINNPTARTTLVRQIIDSQHRVRYPKHIAAQRISSRRVDPADEQYFDPLRAAVFEFNRGELDEACWLVFLFVHFGKHPRGGYRYLRDVYGKLGDGGRWNWSSISTDKTGFLDWLSANYAKIRARGPGGFGNHRKYQSLKPHYTGRALISYVDWVDPARGHRGLFDSVHTATTGDSGMAFDCLYKSMDAVEQFGRTAKFDFLTMIGKLGLSAVNPTRTYLKGATGPERGARRLYGVGTRVSYRALEGWLVELDTDLNVGAQVLEDSICNWQKSPERYLRFKG